MTTTPTATIPPAQARAQSCGLVQRATAGPLALEKVGSPPVIPG